MCADLNLYIGEELVTDIVIPNGVSRIGYATFEGCKSLTSIDIPNSVTSIGRNAFKYCTGLTSVIIPNSVKDIGREAFSNCSSLSTMTIPESVKNIGDLAFCGCSSLTSIDIPNSVSSIEYAAFAGCSSLTSVTIPNNVKSIKLRAFSGCKRLTTMTIPHSVISIEDEAFVNCSSLTTVYIGTGISEVADDAFKGCRALKEVHYPKGMKFNERTFSNSTKMIAYDRANPPAKAFPKTPTLPPLLALVEGSLLYDDVNGNNRIDADEKGKIKFKIINNGKGAAMNCEVRVKMTGSSNGVFVNTIKLPKIVVGKTQEVSIPVTSSINTQDGNVTFTIEVYEPNGWGIAPFDLTVATKAYESPFLQVVDYNVSSYSGKIRKMEPFTLTFNLQNIKYGDAEDVKVKVNLPSNVFVMDGCAELSYPLIKSGEVKPIQLTLAANNNYPTTNIPITIDIKEKHGKFAENKQLDIALDQIASSSINIAAIEEAEQERKEIQLAMIKSDVDRNIPITNTKNSNTFVLIIANEHYSHVASVPFALNDGNIFREYCIKTLGIGEKHIKYLADATGNDLKAGVNWLSNFTEAFDNPQIIVYYAGHGIPDETSKTAYLLPIDGNGADITTGYKLDNLYATLGNMPASQITVFMDACFSGSKREDGMLASARGVALKAKSGVPQGNMVVFSAAQGDETAYPNREQQHGLFTYYLLKKLQESAGDISLKDLGDYITKQVTQQSLLINDKKQTPCVIPSASVASEWQNWKLK